MPIAEGDVRTPSIGAPPSGARWQTALGLAIALVLMELVVRRTYTFAVRFEPEVGYVNAPGTMRYGAEGHGRTEWTEHGVRASTPVDPKRPSVLFLGDSFTEAGGIDQEEAFSEQVAPALAARGIQVVNAGRSTQSTADYTHLAPHFQQLFHPRWVVLTLNEGDLTTDAFQESPRRTRFVRRDDGGLDLLPALIAEHRGLTGAVWFVLQHVMLAGYGYVRFGEFRNAMAHETPLFTAGSTAAPPAPPIVHYPVEAELDALRRAWDDRFTILYLADFDPRHPDRSKADVEPRLLSYCAANHLSCVTTRSAFPEFVRRGIAPYGFSNTKYGEGHMNRDGHAAAGRILEAELVRLIQSAVL